MGSGRVRLLAALAATCALAGGAAAGDAALTVTRVDPGDVPGAALSEHYLTDLGDEAEMNADGDGGYYAEDEARAAADADGAGDGDDLGDDANGNDNGGDPRRSTLIGEDSHAEPANQYGDLENDLTRAGALGGHKAHHIDPRTSHDVEDEVRTKLVIDYQLDYTLYPSMDHTLTPYAKTAPPLEYTGRGERWSTSFDEISKKNVSGWDFESGKGFWMDLSKWHRGAMPTHTYSIDIVFKMHEGGGMRRIMSRTADSEEGLYVYDDKLVFWPHILHTNPDAFKQAGIEKNKWVRVTLTRDGASNQITGAVNGKAVWILSDSSKSAVLPDGRINLFADTTRYSSAGTLGRVRVYSAALGYRHVKLMGRHAVDAVQRHYTYGRRVYRNLVIGDYQLQNSLISSVFSEYPLFVNNRTFVHPRYVADRVEGQKRPEVGLALPAQGLTYALDSAARLHHFDGEEFTISTLVKFTKQPADRFMNLLSWSNDRSQITLRVRNWQLYLSTHDRGDDLHDAMHTGHRSRAGGAKDVHDRLREYLHSSQNEVLRSRLEARMRRIREAEITEQRAVQQIEAEKRAGSPGAASEGTVPEHPRRSLLLKQAELRELRVAAGLAPAIKEGSSAYTPAQFEAKRYEWEARHAHQENEERGDAASTANLAVSSARGRGPAEPVTVNGDDAGDAGDTSSSSSSSAKYVPTTLVGQSGDNSESVFAAASSPSSSSAAADLGPAEPAAVDGDGLDATFITELLLQRAAEVLLSREESANSEEEADLWHQEVNAHLPRTSREETDKKIEACFMRGGKWRFAPIDKCSLDLENDIEQAPRPYDVHIDLATSIHDSIKTDKWVAVTLARSLEGTVECYVNGRRAFRYTDRNTTGTEIRSDGIQIATPDAAAPAVFPGVLGRVILYDQHLRSTEIREMVRGTEWSPRVPINPSRAAGDIVVGKPETIDNCLVFTPIWNARSSHPGVHHGATMVWIRNYCRKDFQVRASLCGQRFECNAQARSYMSCGTITDSYCSSVTKIKEVADISFL
jgi:hypothetical protein